MHVEFTIPGWVGWALLAYYVAGLVLTPALATFDRHYISPLHSAWDTLRRLRWRWLPVAATFWPYAAYYAARCIKRYGWKGL